MQAQVFMDILAADFYTGVPDSLLQPMCDRLLDMYGTGYNHVIAANEGNAVGLAAGYHMATGKTPVVYMQNSGIGNALNPIVSLLSERVYAIPCIFVVGLRGQPGMADEPQHLFQGEITEGLLKRMGLTTFVLDAATGEATLAQRLEQLRPLLAAGQSIAILVEKGALEYKRAAPPANPYTLRREEVIQHILHTAKNDPIVCTTGKASRELYELREGMHQGHQQDFLTVGSMGHSSSIALGVALQKPGTKVWCIDGDGAAIMHMGALATIGNLAPPNLVHIILNNVSHESVGGAPTAGDTAHFTAIAKACGYGCILSANTPEELQEALQLAQQADNTVFLEVKVAIGARETLGRPGQPPKGYKDAFSNHLQSLE